MRYTKEATFFQIHFDQAESCLHIDMLGCWNELDQLGDFYLLIVEACKELPKDFTVLVDTRQWVYCDPALIHLQDQVLIALKSHGLHHLAVMARGSFRYYHCLATTCAKLGIHTEQFDMREEAQAWLAYKRMEMAL